MPSIHIIRKHGSNKQKAMNCADEIAQNLAESYDINYGWEDDILHFERSGVDGQITLSDSKIEISCQLGLLLTVFKSKIESEIHEHINTHFGVEDNI